MAALSDFIPVWLETDFLAVLTRNNDGNYIFRASERGGSDTVDDGDLDIGPGTAGPITAIRLENENTRLFINDNGNPEDLGEYFDAGGAGNDLHLVLQYDGVFARFPVAGAIVNEGSNYIRFDMPEAFHTLLATVPDGEEYLFGAGRYGATTLADFDHAGRDLDFAGVISKDGTVVGHVTDVYDGSVPVEGDLQYGLDPDNTIDYISHADNAGVYVLIQGQNNWRDYTINGGGLRFHFQVGSKVLFTDESSDLALVGPLLASRAILDSAINAMLRDLPNGTNFLFAVTRAIPSFDDTGLDVDFNAVLRIHRQGETDQEIYVATERGGTDTPLAGGDLGLGSGETRITRVRIYDNPGGDNPYPFVLFDNDVPEELPLGTYFSEGGGADLTLYFQVNDTVESVSVASSLDPIHRSGNWANFALPSAMHDLVDNLVDGALWLLAGARPGNPTTVVADAGPNQDAQSGQQVLLGRVATVEDGVGPTTYLWERVSGTGGTLTSATAIRPIFTCPTVTAGDGIVTIIWRVTVTNNGVSDYDDVLVHVTAGTPPPTPPLVWTGIANQTTDVNQDFSLQLAGATGGDGSAITYAVTGLPAGVAFNAATRTISGRPTASGLYSITATATQSDTVLSESFTWTLRAVVTEVSIASTPMTGDTYGLGETIEIRVAFSNNVTQSSSGILVAFDSETFGFAYFAGSGTSTLRYRHAVLSSDSDADGISIPAGNLLGTLTSNGVAVNKAVAGLAAQAGHKVDPTQVAPTAPSIPDLTISPGVAGSYQFPAVAGSPTPTASITSALPAGITFANGRLSWTVEVAVGTYLITYRLTNALGFAETTFRAVVVGSFGAAFRVLFSGSAQVHTVGINDVTGLQHLTLGAAALANEEAISWTGVGNVDTALTRAGDAGVRIAEVTLTLDSESVSVVLEDSSGNHVNLSDAVEGFENAVQFTAPGIARFTLDPEDASQEEGYSWVNLGSVFVDFFQQLRSLDQASLANTVVTLDDGRRAITGAFSVDFEANARIHLAVAHPHAQFRALFTGSAALGVFEPAPRSRARQFRYGIHIPAVAGLPAWAWWNGQGSQVIDGLEYQAGQFASHTADDPVSGIIGGELAGNFSVQLLFGATGLFRTWLLAGDHAGREAHLYSFAVNDDGNWVVVNRILGTRLGLAQLRSDGLIAVDVSSLPADRANAPDLLTSEVHEAEFPGDTALQWRGRLAKGYKLDFP